MRTSKTSFTDLPSEIVIHILQFCQGSDILNLDEALNNKDFGDLVYNKSLWKTPFLGPTNLRKYLKYLGSHTTKISILGFVKVKPQSFKPSKQVYDKSEQLADSVINSIRLRCPNLTSLHFVKCVIDIEKVKISLFPKTLKHLKFNQVVLLNLPQVRTAITASPFFSIKKALPLLETLFLENPWFLRPCDSLAIISGCKLKPSLEIQGSDHHYTFSEDSSTLSRGARRDTSKHFIDLIDFHCVKNKYNTRRKQPSEN